MLVRFVVVEPESKRGSHTVRLPLLVGRSREAKFRIQQERVSRRHCELTADDGVVFVRDLGSTNGTQLEGTAVSVDSPTHVPPGALLRVGSIGFLVDYDRFAETPTVQVTTDYDGVEAVLSAAEVLPWGVRVECRLAEPAEEPLEIPVDVFVQSSR